MKKLNSRPLQVLNLVNNILWGRPYQEESDPNNIKITLSKVFGMGYMEAPFTDKMDEMGDNEWLGLMEREAIKLKKEIKN